MEFPHLMWFLLTVVHLYGALPLDQLKYDFDLPEPIAQHAKNSDVDVLPANFQNNESLINIEYKSDRFQDSACEMAVQNINSTLVSESAKATLHLGLLERGLNDTIQTVGKLSTEAGNRDQRIQTISSALIAMEAVKSNARLAVLEQKVTSLTAEFNALHAKLETFIQASKNNIDETAVANSITAAIGQPADQEAFIKALLETLSNKFSDHNIMIFNTAIDYEENFENVIFFRTLRYGHSTFFVWVFKGQGTFTNKGRVGGWRNWGFNGHRDDTTGPYFLKFHA